MVIGNAQLNMEATRTFKATGQAISGTLSAVNKELMKVSSLVETVEGEKKTVNGQAKTDDFSSSLDNATKADKASEQDKAALGGKGFNLNGRSLLKLNKSQNESERMSSRRVREQTLMYLLLRLRKMLTGEEASLDEYNWGTQSTGNGYSSGAQGTGNIYGIGTQGTGNIYGIGTQGTGNVYSLGTQSAGNLYGYGTQNIGDEYSITMNGSAGEVLGYRISARSYEESETTEFTTTGKVVTKDGRELNFNIALNMSRKFYTAVESISEVVGTSVANLIDPLVINLDANPASVSDQKFLFDLDQDGKEENISALGKGSGFLAIDLNGDGAINNGSELFGTKSGDGFGDLSKYDEDGNGWIDEADAVFEKLLVWTKDEDGNDKLYKLKDLDIGALSLESVNTEFSLNNDNNKTEAVIRHTGFFLYENGRAGTMQHLDLAT